MKQISKNFKFTFTCDKNRSFKIVEQPSNQNLDLQALENVSNLSKVSTAFFRSQWVEQKCVWRDQ